MPPLCRETSVSRTANVETVGKNRLRRYSYTIDIRNMPSNSWLPALNHLENYLGGSFIMKIWALWEQFVNTRFKRSVYCYRILRQSTLFGNISQTARSTSIFFYMQLLFKKSGYAKFHGMPVIIHRPRKNLRR